MEGVSTDSQKRNSRSMIFPDTAKVIVKTPNGTAISDPKVSKVEITVEEQKRHENLYYIELMVTSGPRKDINTYRSNTAHRELGEDAGGVLSLPGMYLFWIADGTSDEKSLYDFSSRILAQDLGMCFKKCAYDMFLERRTINFRQLIETTFKYLENEWKQRLSEKWKSLSTPEEKHQYKNLLSPCGDGSLRRSWSSTFLAGIINFNEEKLQCLNLGDAGGLIYHKKGEKKDIIPQKSGRCYMSIDCYPNSDEPIVSPKLYWYLFSWDDILGNDRNKLLQYLDLAESVQINKSDDGKTIHISKDENSAKMMIDENAEKVILTINDGIAHNLKVKKENGKLNIYEDVVEFDQVDMFIFMTDGNTSMPLKEFFNSRATMPTDLLVLIKRLRENTGDDKCILVGSKIGGREVLHRDSNLNA